MATSSVLDVKRFLFSRKRQVTKRDDMMTPSAIPMAHMSIVSTMLDLVTDLGAPLESSLATAGLPVGILETRTGYVPVRALCRWVDATSRRQGIDNIGLRSVMRSGIRGLQQTVVEKVAAQPSLYLGLRQFCELAYLESSRVAIWLDERHEEIRLCHRGSLPRQVGGQPEMSWWAIGILIQIARLYLGPRWMPNLIGYPAQTEDLEAAVGFFPNTMFIPDPQITWIAIPRRLLASGPRVGRSAPLRGYPHNEAPPADLLTSVKQLIELRLADNPLKIEEAAECAGVSTRSFQRYLASEKCTFKDLVVEVRFGSAKRMLAESNLPVTSIAPLLGYTDPSHFARAFRRVTGVSPREYRRSVNSVESTA